MVSVITTRTHAHSHMHTNTHSPSWAGQINCLAGEPVPQQTSTRVLVDGCLGMRLHADLRGRQGELTSPPWQFKLAMDMPDSGRYCTRRRQTWLGRQMGLSVLYPAGRRHGRWRRWDLASCTPPAHRLVTGSYIPYDTELSMAGGQMGLSVPYPAGRRHGRVGRWDLASCTPPAADMAGGEDGTQRPVPRRPIG